MADGAGSVPAASADGTRSVPGTLAADAFFAGFDATPGGRKLGGSALSESDWESGLLGMPARERSSGALVSGSVPLDGRLLAGRRAWRETEQEVRLLGGSGEHLARHENEADILFADLGGVGEDTTGGEPPPLD